MSLSREPGTALRPDLVGALRPHPALEVLAEEPGVHVVGGAVRDVLLGRRPHELDVLVEGDAIAVARRVAERLGGEAVAHERFGTATVRAAGHTFDLAAARRERYARPGALPEVEPGASVAEDLARRDLTVNAIALRLADGRLTAWPGALEDLGAGVLRVLHDASFRDDPTRMLRAARYAARLGFAVEPHTDALWARAIRDRAVETVTGPRLGEELRLALREPQPAALRALERHGLAEAVLGLPFGVHEPVVEAALALTPPDGRDDLVALAACVGPATGAEIASALDRLGFPAAERGIVKAAATSAAGLADALARGAGDHDGGGPLGDDELWRSLRRETAEAVALAGAREPAAAPAARRWLEDVRHRRLAITGDDLVAAGLHGPAVGLALDAAMAAHLRGEAPDRDSQLAAALR
jgi:tRNA nucleotidyltransferase (CCA-adding enzyme)